MPPRKAITLDDLAPHARRQAVAQLGGAPELGDAGHAAWAKTHPENADQLAADADAEHEMLRRQEPATGGGGAKTRKRPWSAAVPTTGADGVRYPSKMEARVAAKLRAECAATGSTLYRQVRLPLLAIAPRKDGKPFVLTVDFFVAYPNGGGRYVEAKGARRSRDYELRKAAAEKTWHVVVNEDDGTPKPWDHGRAGS